MREILFRGKRKDNGELIIGAYFLMKHNDGRQHYHHFIIPEGIDVSIGTPIEKIQVEIIPETVGQYTGLPDKNGKKIFEGDILEFSEDYDDKFGYPATSYGKCIVIYDESLLAWRIRGLDYEGLDDLCEYADSEVIGNIHDNPELLKEAEQE